VFLHVGVILRPDIGIPVSPRPKLTFNLWAFAVITPGVMLALKIPVEGFVRKRPLTLLMTTLQGFLIA
jgi:hypothetical protein